MKKSMRFTNPSTRSAAENPPIVVDVTPVDVEPIPRPAPEPFLDGRRRLSWLGWAVALAIFAFNRKLGLVVFVLLLVFGLLPTVNLKGLPARAGELYRKIRS